MTKGNVGLFFFTNDGLLSHKCSLADAERNGDFLNYSESHDDVWQREYARKYHVDFDYFPRGRVIYNARESRFIIYVDRCLSNENAVRVLSDFDIVRLNRKTEFDEHYQCHMCNKNYVE